MHTPFTMARKQIYLDEELAEALRALAARTGVPEATHVRAALRQYLDAHLAPLDRAEPLLEMIGLVNDADGPTDVAEEHDHYLYGTRKRRGP